MTITNTLDLATFGPVIPVIVLEQVEHAVPLARALVAGGVRVLEVTLRAKAALACMEAIARDVPEAIVGAGTLRTVDDVHAAKRAGCVLGVSPGYTSEMGAACREAGLPLLPGVATARAVVVEDFGTGRPSGPRNMSRPARAGAVSRKSSARTVPSGLLATRNPPPARFPACG